MKTKPARLSYAELRRRAATYQQMVEARIERLLRGAGADPTQLVRARSGRYYVKCAVAADPIRQAKVREALHLAQTRLYAAHIKIARLVVKGRTDIGHLRPLPAGERSHDEPSPLAEAVRIQQTI